MIARSTSSRTRDASSPTSSIVIVAAAMRLDPVKSVDDSGQLSERRARPPAVARLLSVGPQPLPRLRAEVFRRHLRATVEIDAVAHEKAVRRDLSQQRPQPMVEVERAAEREMYLTLEPLQLGRPLG